MSLEPNYQPDELAIYDTETTGLSHHYDQAVQFAGIRVDRDLNIIPGSELVLDIKPRPDVIPGPIAFAITGISMSHLLKNGLSEWEAAGKIRDWIMKPKVKTLLTGFNSQRFDDEVLRNLFFRTMIGPYEHEWKNGNSRADILRLVTMVFALRPELLHWPLNHEGRFSLKLGDLCRENGIVLDHAHDARFDVMATLDLMRVVKKASPKLWNYFIGLSDKGYVTDLAHQRKPIAVVNSFFPREQGHLSIMLPIIMDAVQPKTKMWCVDLRQDPTELLSLAPEEINRRMFTSINDLGEGEGISSVRNIALNKQPMICGLNIFQGRMDVAARAGLDIERCLKHAAMIDADEGFRARLQQAMISEFAPCEDPYEGLYSMGMIGRDEQNLRSRMRRVDKATGKTPEIVTTDSYALSTESARDRLRMFTLAVRAKWANFTDLVLQQDQFSPSELGKWVEHLDSVWFKSSDEVPKNARNYEMYLKELAEVRATYALDPVQTKAINEMEAYVAQHLVFIDDMKQMTVNLKENAEVEQALRTEVGMIENDRKSREARNPETGVDFPL